MIYWDTSTVIKLYVPEPDSEAWQNRAVHERRDIVSSSLLEAEFAFAVGRKEQLGDLRTGGARKLCHRLQSDISYGRIKVFPLSFDIVSAATAIALEGYPRQSVRTLDGLHLATAIRLHCREFVTTDRRLASAARALGFHVISQPD